MKKKLLIFSYLIISFIFAKAQVIYSTSQLSVTTQPLRSVFFTDTNTGYAVGNNGTIVKTINSGITWTTQLSGTDNQLFSIYFIDSNIGWIVGSNSTILKTINGGATWSSQITGFSNNHFSSVYFTDANTGYIVTLAGKIIKTIDGGNTWFSQKNQIQSALFSTCFVDSNTGYIVGGTGLNGGNPSSMIILKTTNGGNTWSAITNVITDGALFSVHFVNSSIGYAVGVKNNGLAAILKTTDGGNAWSETIVPTAYSLRSVYFIDENNGFCSGDGGLTFRTTDGGTTWIDISEIALKNKGLYSIFFINQSIGWQVCSNGTIIKYKSTIPVITLPTISTSAMSSITATTAFSGGNISSDGGESVTARGVCWSTSINPTIADSKTTDGNGIGTFTSSITGLIPNTSYYVRAYATNIVGTAYGNEISFTTNDQTIYGQPCPGMPTVTDIDGNVYNTVQIGGQCWIKENLKVTHYTDGSSIRSNLSNNEWKNDITGAYAIYPYSQVNGVSSDAEMLNSYGALYNWYVINDSRGVCPTGWEVPSYEQWNDLVLYLDPNADLNNSNQSSVAGGKLKDKSTAPQSHPRWDGPNTNATNETGFSAFPGGDRYEEGDFMQNGTDGRFWSSTSNSSCCSWAANLSYFSGSFTRIGSFKNHGYSIRCIKVSTTHTLTLPISPASAGTASGAGDYEVGEQVSITAAPAQGYLFVNWTLNGVIISTSTSFTYTMPAEDITIVANFEEVSTVSDGQPCPGVPTITDIDGNLYNTVKIGGQCWISENLKTTKYNDGSSIPIVTNSNEWSTIETPAYCWYQNDQNMYGETYGALYNWYTVNTGKLCPIGWRVPTDTEWTSLVNYAGYSFAGQKLKTTSGWVNGNGTNDYGFSASPGGNRWTFGFMLVGYHGSWWSSSQQGDYYAWYFNMNNNYIGVAKLNTGKYWGMSVRCIKN